MNSDGRTSLVQSYLSYKGGCYLVVVDFFLSPSKIKKFKKKQFGVA